MTEKILKIQNGMKSLSWGHTRHSETETLFAVGHKSYHLLKYFIVGDDFRVYDANGVYKVLVNKCCSEDEVLSVVFDLLKKWFPAKESMSHGNAEKVS